MSKYFYRDIKIIKFCKVCGTEYRPARGSPESALGLCQKHRKEYYLKSWKKFSERWVADLSPAEFKEYRKRQYEVWKKWVEKNLVKRRQQALGSYHRNKDKHRDRRHRATHKPS